MPKPVTVDFETEKINGRPMYPPKPVGVSIKMWGKKPQYYAFGHPTKNNSTFAKAKVALQAVWGHKDGLLFQNGKFDVDVAEVHFQLKVPEWRQIHDTMFLLFLDDPHQQELGLKPSATRLLNMPPDEQDEVMEWLLRHQPVPGIKLSKSKASENYWGGYISYAPGDIVGKYANGDTIRTEKLFAHLYPKTVERDMLRAYDRERELMPILLDMERWGLPVDLKRLRTDVKKYDGWLTVLDQWVIKTIKAPKDINLDSGDQLVMAMIKAGKADPDKMPRTAGGKISFAKDSLLAGVTDKALLAVLKYRASLKTCLNTFMKPWLLTAESSGGLIFTNWNQTKQPSGDANVGTRTGRLSSTPNFQNLPKEFNPIFAHEEPDAKKRKGMAKCPIPGLPSLPMCRSYITPFKGHVLIDRDYSQQEPRILAHFDAGELLAKYLENPWIDFHDFARIELAKKGLYYERKPVKNTNLGLIYGMGAPKLAAKNNMSVEESRHLKGEILKLYPGLEDMYKDMKKRAREKKPVKTWGGREYYCEEPRIIEGRLRAFDYKLVNVLIQGSAADCTKEAIIRFANWCKANKVWGLWKLLLNVHDQLTASVPVVALKKAMEALRVTMESVEFDLPILSEGTISHTNWNDLKDYDKKGKLV
jgi:DNA polymerase-1